MMLKPMSVQRGFGEGVVGLVQTPGVVVPEVGHFLPSPD